MNLSYLIIGAGATGGCIGGYLAASGKSVALIARGEQLQKIKQSGLTIEKADGSLLYLPEIPAFSQKEYEGQADIIFICVKGYALPPLIPFVRNCCHKNTVVIPILNLYGTGEAMASKLPGISVLDGCIYIASEVLQPGFIKQRGEIFRIVFGSRDGNINDPFLKQVESDLRESKITPILSKSVKVDTYRKFSYVSAQNAVGIYYNANAGMIRKDEGLKKDFMECVSEIRNLGLAMDVPLEPDIPQINFDILAALDDDMTTSMQKDIAAGKATEIDGLIFEVVRLARRYQVSLPTYERIAKKLEQDGFGKL